MQPTGKQLPGIATTHSNDKLPLGGAEAMQVDTPAAPEFRITIWGDRDQLLSDAPDCVKEMCAGQAPGNTADFSTCVGWLAKYDMTKGLKELLASPQCSKFHRIDLSNQPIEPSALKALAFQLDTSAITALKLTGCGLGGAHAEALGMLCGKNSKLAVLDLGYNQLGSTPAFTVLCASLRTNSTLTALKLDNCGLNLAEVQGLLWDFVPGRGSEVNKTIACLSLAHNPLVDQGGLRKAYVVYPMLNPSTCIECLDMTGTGVAGFGGDRVDWDAVFGGVDDQPELAEGDGDVDMTAAIDSPVTTATTTTTTTNETAVTMTITPTTTTTMVGGVSAAQVQIPQGLPATATDFDMRVALLAQKQQAGDLKALLAAPGCARFDRIDLHGQRLSPEALQTLAVALVGSHITALNLSGCGLGATHGQALGELVGRSPLATLHLGNNDLGGDTDSIPLLCDGLAANTKLKHLTLEYCNLTHEHCATVLGVVSQQVIKGELIRAENTTLNSLSLAGNDMLKPTAAGEDQDLGPSGYDGLGDMPGITNLDLRGTNILQGMRATADLLRNLNGPLAGLNLSHNRIDERAARSLKLLLAGKRVTHLDMGGTKMTAKDRESNSTPLLIELATLPSLKVLDLRRAEGVGLGHSTYGSMYGPSSSDEGYFTRMRNVVAKVRQNSALICVKLDRTAEDNMEHTAHAIAKEVVQVVSGPGGGGFSILAGGGGLMLLKSMEHYGLVLDESSAIGLGALVVKELDKQSASRLMSITRQFSFDRALRMVSNDPNFQWGLAWSGRDDDVDAMDTGEGNNDSTLALAQPPADTFASVLGMIESGHRDFVLPPMDSATLNQTSDAGANKLLLAAARSGSPAILNDLLKAGAIDHGGKVAAAVQAQAGIPEIVKATMLRFLRERALAGMSVTATTATTTTTTNPT